MQRTTFMKSIMLSTYPQVAIIAVKNRTIEGAWEEAIAKQLKEEAKGGHSEAEVILQAAGNDPLKAAYLITNSENT